jgi:membrane associated rhomboid family serine protease
VAIYFSSMLLGSIFTVIPHFKNPGYVAVGYSGAISGILFSFIMFFPKTPINIIFIPIPVPAYLFAIFYIAISIYGVKRSLGNIGHEAHLGGALAGIIMTILIFPDVIGKFLGQF